MNILTKTVKLKLLLDTEQILRVKQVCEEYRKVCNFVSEWVFDNEFVLNFMRLQDKIYYVIRDKFPLNSQMVISALKTVTASYKTMKEQLKQSPYKYATATAKLICKNKIWYLCIPMSTQIELCKLDATDKIVGIDRGLRFIAATADNRNCSLFLSGKAIQHRRHKFAKTRQSLQLKNTRNSRRRLLAIGQRENRWMSDVNHCLSKALVDKYGVKTLFVLEDLTGITFDEKILQGNNQQRQDKRTWAFYQLERFLKYKAECAGSLVINVSARYTSQRCPKCGIVDKNQ